MCTIYFQTAIKIGKGGLKGMTFAAELVWINTFPITAHVSDQLDGMYCCDDKPGNLNGSFTRKS